jgi:chromate reductase, NAD(P)H dehydrogenase (quinone)
MKILAISGSLRPQSANAAILQAVVELVTADVNISIYERIGNLPHFNPDHPMVAIKQMLHSCKL